MPARKIMDKDRFLIANHLLNCRQRIEETANLTVSAIAQELTEQLGFPVENQFVIRTAKVMEFEWFRKVVERKKRTTKKPTRKLHQPSRQTRRLATVCLHIVNELVELRKELYEGDQQRLQFVTGSDKELLALLQAGSATSPSSNGDPS